MGSGHVAVAAVALLLAATPACSDLSRFTTDADDSYCGPVIAAGFVRKGLDDKATMRLKLDAAHLQDAPGTIWISGNVGAAGPVDGVVLESVPELARDPLSSLSFGEGRVANSISVMHVGDVEVWVVLSLMQSGDVEVRLLHGSPAREDATAHQDLQVFGVFQLHKHKTVECTP
jgi:hypothetical protein